MRKRIPISEEKGKAISHLAFRLNCPEYNARNQVTKYYWGVRKERGQYYLYYDTDDLVEIRVKRSELKEILINELDEIYPLDSVIEKEALKRKLRRNTFRLEDLLPKRLVDLIEDEPLDTRER